MGRDISKSKNILIRFYKPLLFLSCIGIVFFIYYFSTAEADTLGQTDWSGGVGALTATQYSAGTNIDDATTGEISLDQNGEELSNTGFESDFTGWSATETFSAKSISFDGTNEYMSVADSNTLSFGNGTTDSPFSVSFWVYVDSYNGENADVMAKSGSNTNEYQLLLLGASSKHFMLSLYNNNTGSAYINRQTTAAINEDTWYNIVATYDGSSTAAGIHLYVNGALDDGTAATLNYVAMNNNTANLNLSGYSAISRYANLTMDETAMWDKALSLSEVEEIYNSGVPTDISSHSASANIISWWRMGELYDYSITDGGVFDQVGTNDGTTKNTEVADAIDFVPGEQGAIVTHINSVTNNTLIAHNGSLGSLRVVATSTSAYAVTQSVNVGDTETYNLVAYAYTDGTAVTIADAELIVDGSTIETTYTDAGSGWYKLSGTTTGAAASIAYGVEIKASATVYVDDISLYINPSSATLTSNIFDTTSSTQWGVATFTTSGTGFVTLRVRTDSNADMTGATAFSSCTPIIYGEDISKNNCVTDGDQYLQYQVYLSASQPTVSPVFEDFNVTYVINSSVSGSTIPLRVATFNTQVGLGADGSAKNNAIEAHINRMQPDILTLNEMTDSARSLITSGWAASLGYDYYTHATGGNSEQYNPSILSKYPILNSHYVPSAGGGDEFLIRFLFTEIDITSLTTQKKLGIYSIHATPVCNVNPCLRPNRQKPSLDFERAIQYQRLATDITSTTAAYPTMEIIVMGDHNVDTSEKQTLSFASDPGSHTWGFVLGSDITFPVSYGQQPEQMYAGLDMTIADAKRLDGEYTTAPVATGGLVVPLRIDYISVSEGIEITGSEVLNSETDAAGGITKYNSVLSAGSSATASDHNMVIADIAIVTDITNPTISLTSLTPDPTTDTTPSFSGTASDSANTISSVEYQMDGTSGSWTACTADDGTFNEASEAFTCVVASALSDGSHTIYVRSTDSVSNVIANEDASTDTFTVDTTAPTLSLTAVTPDPTTDTTPSISGTATDVTGTVSSVEYQMEVTSGSWTACTSDDGTFDEAVEAFTCTVASTLSDGSHTIYMRSTDSLSNVTSDANESTDTFVVDTGSPSAIEASPLPGYYPAPPQVTLFSEGSTSIRYSTSTAPSTCSSGTVYSDAISVNTSQTIYALACDDAENSVSASFEYIIFTNNAGSFPAGWSDAPASPVGGFNISVNDGKNVTSNKLVNLNLNAGLDVERMAISLREDFVNVGQEKYISDKKFNICGDTTCPDGEYTIYIKYFTKYGVASDVISQKITLQNKLINTQEIIKSSAKFIKNLHFGFNDIQVMLLQKLLNNIGFTVSETSWGSIGNETNYFGKATSKALIKFQEASQHKQKNILSEKGYVGPVTREFINAIENTNVINDTSKDNIEVKEKNSVSAIFIKPLTFGEISDDVTRLQTLLATDKNIYPQGIVSGYFGTLTETAVQAFQLKYGVVNSQSDLGFGYVGPKTREMLSKVFGQ